MGNFLSQGAIDYIGKGLTFPILLNANGSAVLDTGWALIKSSLNSIFSYSVGTRFFLGEFGSLIEALVEEPNDDFTKSLAISLLNEHLAQWERRVSIIDIDMYQEGDKLNITMKIAILNSSEIQSFVWPHYTNIIY